MLILHIYLTILYSVDVSDKCLFCWCFKSAFTKTQNICTNHHHNSVGNSQGIVFIDFCEKIVIGAKVSILRYFLYFPTYLLYLFWFMQWIPMNFCVHSMFYLLVQASERLLQGTVEVVGNSKFSKAHIPIFLSRYNTSPWPWLKGNSWTFLCRMKCWIGALWCTAVLNLCSYQKKNVLLSFLFGWWKMKIYLLIMRSPLVTSSVFMLLSYKCKVSIFIKSTPTIFYLYIIFETAVVVTGHCSCSILTYLSTDYQFLHFPKISLQSFWTLNQ